MAGINFHPAPGNTHKLPPGWLAVRGTGDIVATQGFSVPDRDMRAPSVAYTATIGDILATQGFNIPDRDMRPAITNPVADYVSGNVKPLGQSSKGGCGCGGSCGGCGGKINGMGVGDLSADWQTFTGSLSNGNFSAALNDTIMGVPVWILLAAAVAIPALMSGTSGRRRR